MLNAFSIALSHVRIQMPTPNVCAWVASKSLLYSIAFTLSITHSFFIIIFCGALYDLWNLRHKLERVSTNKKTTPDTCMLSCLQKPHNAGLV